MPEPNLIILAYFSPETVLPLTSILATVAGAAMLLTRGSLRFLIRCFRIAIRGPRRLVGSSQPHFRSRRPTASEETAQIVATPNHHSDAAV
jgi:hypothetical protein